MLCPCSKHLAPAVKPPQLVSGYVLGFSLQKTKEKRMMHTHILLGRTWEKLNAFAAGFEPQGNTIRHLILQWIADREVVYCCLDKQPLCCCSWAWYFLWNQDLRVFNNEKEHISKHEVSTPDPYVTSFQSGLLYAGTVGLVYLPSCVLLPSS